MSNTLEVLHRAIVGRIGELRSRTEDMSTDLAALLEAFDSPNAQVKRQVGHCLREAAEHIERALDELEGAESAAGGAFELTDAIPSPDL
jgi:hypothetical protein